MDEARPGKVPPRRHDRKAMAAEPPESFVRKKVIQPMNGGSKVGPGSTMRKARLVVRKGQSLADIDVNEAHREAIAWAKRHPKSFEALGRT